MSLEISVMLGIADFSYVATMRNLSREIAGRAIVSMKRRRAYRAFLRIPGGGTSNSGFLLVLYKTCIVYYIY